MAKQDLILSEQTPNPREYVKIREVTGLSPRTLENGLKALPNSLYAVCLRDQVGELMGMGRLVGDGGSFVQIVDIAVHPDIQGQGYGKKIMAHLMAYIDLHMPDHTFVNLFADGDAQNLYKKYGFKETAPESVGMGLKMPRHKSE